MEIIHVFMVRGKNYSEAIDDVKRLNIEINVPDSRVMIKALEYQMEYESDPYDSIAFAIAETAGCEIFYSEEDEGYIATVPELPRCSAFGNTKEVSLEEVKIAMELWLKTA